MAEPRALTYLGDGAHHEAGHTTVRVILIARGEGLETVPARACMRKNNTMRTNSGE